jgi:hypothetical protein
VGAECPNGARSVLCGGRSVMSVPTAIYGICQDRNPFELPREFCPILPKACSETVARSSLFSCGRRSAGRVHRTAELHQGLRELARAPEIGTAGSMSGDGKRGVAEWPRLPRPSSTLPTRTSRCGLLMSAIEAIPESICSFCALPALTGTAIMGAWKPRQMAPQWTPQRGFPVCTSRQQSLETPGACGNDRSED